MIWATVLGAILNAALAIWAFRPNTHRIRTAKANLHFFGFATLVMAALAISISGSILAILSSAAERLELMNQITKLEVALKSAQAPVIAIEQVGTIPIPGGGQTLMIKIRNTGRHPALHTHAFLSLNRGHNPTEADLHYDEKEALNDVSLPSEGEMMDAVSQRISTKNLNAWASGADGMKTYLVGSIWYSDELARKTELPFCYVLTKQRFWQQAKAKGCS